jgi:pseudaminic acid synthase
MKATLQIGQKTVGPGCPTYVIAELSANHGGDYDQAVRTIQAAKRAGADAVKLQTYTADTITLRSERKEFRIGGGTLWDGRTLHDLYGEAYTPWEWQPKLKQVAEDLGLDLFSSPFDSTAVDFLESMNVPAYKVASFELVDIPLIRKIARTGKPVIMSVGMASMEEIEEAIDEAKQEGCQQIALLKCTSAYPASPVEMNLKTIPYLAERFKVPVGLSDHSMTTAVPVSAVALGACIVEKHFILSRAVAGPDRGFSLEPDEFEEMARAIRVTEQALGTVCFDLSERETSSRVFRRSLFVVSNVKKGEVFTTENVRSIRPSYGLHTRYLEQILSKQASCDIEAGTPLTWDMVDSTARVEIETP